MVLRWARARFLHMVLARGSRPWFSHWRQAIFARAYRFRHRLMARAYRSYHTPPPAADMQQLDGGWCDTMAFVLLVAVTMNALLAAVQPRVMAMVGEMHAADVGTTVLLLLGFLSLLVPWRTLHACVFVLVVGVFDWRLQPARAGLCKRVATMATIATALTVLALLAMMCLV